MVAEPVDVRRATRARACRPARARDPSRRSPARRRARSSGVNAEHETTRSARGVRQTGSRRRTRRTTSTLPRPAREASARERRGAPPRVRPRSRRSHFGASVDASAVRAPAAISTATSARREPIEHVRMDPLARDRAAPTARAPCGTAAPTRGTVRCARSVLVTGERRVGVVAERVEEARALVVVEDARSSGCSGRRGFAAPAVRSATPTGEGRQPRRRSAQFFSVSCSRTEPAGSRRCSRRAGPRTRRRGSRSSGSRRAASRRRS